MIGNVLDMPPPSHIGYVVHDVRASAEGFHRLLGIADFLLYDFVPLRAWAEGRKLAPCALRIGSGSLAGGLRVELIQPVEGATPHARFLEEHGPGLHHVAFSTSQYERWRRHFTGLGAEIAFEAETEDLLVGYRRSCYLRLQGVDGLVEISEIPRVRAGQEGHA